MEIANHWVGTHNTVCRKIRAATTDDKEGIINLMQTAPHYHAHLDWRLPVNWLGMPGFVIAVERPSPAAGFISRMFGARTKVKGCLVATADPPPAAWVRVACLSEVDETEAALWALFAEAERQLKETVVSDMVVSEINWLAIERWPRPFLPGLGFEPSIEIETYYKNDLKIPPFRATPDLLIRPAQPEDMAALEKIEEAAFAPRWRHSQEGLTQAAQQSLSFDVAVLHGRIVGFQFSTQFQNSAHLARMTVSPELRQMGIGSTLLAHAIVAYRKKGLTSISLNTQTDNHPSQRLYQKFGFYSNNERLPVWQKVL